MKILITSILIIGITILTILSLRPIDLRDDLIILPNENYDQYLIDIGLDDEALTIKEKEIIYDYQLDFLKTGLVVDYITPSSNPYLYERNWSIDQLLNRDLSPDIKLSSYLFQSPDETYHIFISYELSHRTTGNHFFTLNKSDDYRLEFNNQYLTLYDQNNEYLIGGSGYLTSSILDGYRLNSFSLNQYFKNPKTRGFYHFIITPETGADQSFLQIDIALYQDITTNSNQIIILGFNGFKANPNQPKFIPQAMQITYIKEGL